MENTEQIKDFNKCVSKLQKELTTEWRKDTKDNNHISRTKMNETIVVSKEIYSFLDNILLPQDKFGTDDGYLFLRVNNFAVFLDV